MPRSPVVRCIARAVIVATLVASVGVGISACGQRGPLYSPDAANPDKRR